MRLFSSLLEHDGRQRASIHTEREIRLCQTMISHLFVDTYDPHSQKLCHIQSFRVLLNSQFWAYLSSRKTAHTSGRAFQQVPISTHVMSRFGCFRHLLPKCRTLCQYANGIIQVKRGESEPHCLVASLKTAHVPLNNHQLVSQVWLGLVCDRLRQR